jgi:endonuclease G
MREFILSLTWLALAAGVAGAQGHYVEASRHAVVRADHDPDAERWLTLERGDRLPAVSGGQTESFYDVRLPDGRLGWVSRYVVRLHEGALAAGELAAAATAAGVTGTGTVGGLSADAAFHLEVGRPLGYEVVAGPGFVLGYDPRLKIPAWVQYRLTRERSETEVLERTDSFDEDVALPAASRAALADYAAVSSDYVRGHMAPADDMLWSAAAEAASNLLSNIAPQIGTGYNGSVWLRLENRVRRWILAREELTVITGPVFSARPRVLAVAGQPATDRQMLFNVVGANDVAVPTAFYKIVVDARDPQAPDVLAFLVPHVETHTDAEREVDQYLTSVDAVEAATGLDFLSGLPAAVQADVESRVPDHSW